MWRKPKVKHVTNVNSDDFVGAMEIYSKSFPANETRPVENTKDMVAVGNHYHLFITKEKKTVTSMALVYVFGRFALLDYMAVNPSMQRRGIGSKLFRGLVNELKDAGIVETLLLEVQKEARGESKRVERIDFYRRLGVKTVLDNYLLPSYVPGEKAEETYLMSCPVSSDLGEFSKSEVRGFVSTIHQRVYEYKQNDLLELVMRPLPETIRAK